MIDETIRALEAEKLIVIVRGIERNSLIPLAEAMYRGGIRFLEVTFCADGRVSDEETEQNIRLLAEHFRGRMHIGSGTVLNVTQVERTHRAGGEFIISPDTVPDVIRKTKELGMLSIPGALTPTEIQLAHRSGADFVKLFPMTALGTDYVKAVKAPLSHIRLLAVGGINAQNMSDYLKSGIVGFGIGSNIVSKQLVAAGDYEAITELAKTYVTVVKTWQPISQ